MSLKSLLPKYVFNGDLNDKTDLARQAIPRYMLYN